MLMQFDPLISIRLDLADREYQSGDILECEYQIDAVESDEMHAVEAAVLWYTSGKGDEDQGIHYYQRETRKSRHLDQPDLRVLTHFTTTLPNSPFSYEGTNLKIQWCVRVRILIQRDGQTLREYIHDQGFQLQRLPLLQS
jgi:hypothetical protein